MPNTHHLKTWPAHFSPLYAGDKTAEIRKDDRGYAIGDTLVLIEWDKDLYDWAIEDGCDDAGASEFATIGRIVKGVVTHILRGAPWLPDGYVMLSFRRLPDA